MWQYGNIIGLFHNSVPSIVVTLYSRRYKLKHASDWLKCCSSFSRFVINLGQYLHGTGLCLLRRKEDELKCLAIKRIRFLRVLGDSVHCDWEIWLSLPPLWLIDGSVPGEFRRTSVEEEGTVWISCSLLEDMVCLKHFRGYHWEERIYRNILSQFFF